MLYITDRNKYPLQLFLREVLVMNQAQNMLDASAEDMARQAMRAEGIKYSVIVVSSVPMLILYPFVQKFFVKGVMIGAIKG
jgi:putative aldouronate transport system permease protein